MVRWREYPFFDTFRVYRFLPVFLWRCEFKEVKSNSS